MAIDFTTGTINAANAGSVGQEMVERMRDDISAHAAWEFVEEFTPVGGLVRWYVLKCLEALNTLTTDYYVVIGRTLGNGELRAFACEGYDAATKICTFFSSTLSSPSSTGVTLFDGQGRNSGAYTLDTTVLTAQAGINSPRHAVWIPSGVSTKWWLTVSEDGFTVAFNGASNGWMHLGAYEWLGSLPNSNPIHYLSSGYGGGYSGILRNPAVAGLNAGGQALGSADSPGSTNAIPIFQLGFGFRLDQNDKLASDMRPVSELGFVLDSHLTGVPTHPNGPEQIGRILGKVKRMRYGTNPPAGVAFGDAYVLNGKLWVPYLPTDGRIWDTGVLA